MKKLLNEVLEKVKPSSDERKKIEKFSKEIISKIKKKGYKAEIEGSLAKDTWISGNHDIDIFVFFNKNVSRKELEEKGLKLGKGIIRSIKGKPEIAYAEHPYVRTQVNGFTLDIVPCYSLKSTENLQSAVDRTPFHTSFVRKNLSENQKDETRFLKQFMKGIGVYSAKEKVRGFSGYLCELLIIKYKTFSKLVKEASNWSYGVTFELNREGTGKNFEHCMTFIDPIDKNRNVAAALEPDNFENFILACREFLENPKIEFFFPNEVNAFSKEEVKKILEKHGRFLLLKFKTPKVIEDVLYSQLRRSIKVIKNSLEKEDFKIIDSGFFSDKESYFLFEFETLELPKIKKVEGPPIKISKEHQTKFLEKYEGKESWVEDGRLYVEVLRKYTKAEDILKNFLKNPRFLGISEPIVKSILKKYSLFKTNGILKEHKGEFAKFLTAYLTKKKPWEWHG